MQVKSKGRKRKNQGVLDAIKSVGYSKIAITKKQWKLKRPPGTYILRQRLGAEYRVQTIINDAGWVIQKIK